MAPSILPTTPAAAAAPAAQTSQSAVLATAPDPPPAAARLDPGSIITGTALGRDSQGLVNIRTDKGVLALATSANLPIGSTVSLEVRVAGTAMQLVILSVETPSGAPPSLPNGPGGGQRAPLPAPAGPAAPTPATILAALSGGNPVMATVVHAVHPPPPSRPGAAPSHVPGTVAQTQVAAAPGTAPPPPVRSGAAATAAPPTIPAAGRPAPASSPGPPFPSGGPSAPSAAAGQTPGVLPSGTTATAGPAPPGPAGKAAPALADPAVGGAPPIARTAGPQTPQPLTEARAASSPAAPVASLARPGPAISLPPLPVGMEIGLRIVGAALPGSPPPDLPARPAGAPPVTAGIVTSMTPAGHPVLDTPAGRMVLAVKAALPFGTTLLIELPPALTASVATAAPAALHPDQAILRLARGWPALAEALAVLDAVGDPARAALAAKLPQTGPRLAAGLMEVMTRLTSGDIGEWLAPAAREALERSGNRNLVDRLRNELQQLSRLAGEPAGGDWRVMFLPLQDGSELHQINLYLRGRRRGRDGEPLDAGTRFVVEVDMTRLGPIQLDGLVHGRRFDLMLRSRTALSPAMRRDIEAIFEEARAIGGYAGAIGFQVAASFPVAPLEQAKRKRSAGGVVV